jgi:hypothetical protein
MVVVVRVLRGEGKEGEAALQLFLPILGIMPLPSWSKRTSVWLHGGDF